MTPAKLRKKVIAERVNWVRDMLAGIRDLAFDDRQIFQEDDRNFAAAESYLRRALEALLDLGRHILAKGFATPVAEYKDIARHLLKEGVLSDEVAKRLVKLAGYRKRMVHFYHEITKEELFKICCQELADVEIVLDEILSWIRQYPARMNDEL
ncbi:MAG: DUF86 domain-containing protein [Candidatus Thorarchaeota archaeon]